MRVYLDHNATTPLDGRVREAVEPWLAERFGNASSRDHRWGWEAAEAVEDARAAVAEAAGVGPRHVAFVAGATEALNTVIRSFVGLTGWPRKRIVTCATEHEAVLAPSRYLCAHTGVALDVLGVDRLGHVDLDALRAAVGGAPDVLVALMAANNETGTLHPVREIAEIVHGHGGRLLCDTTQAFGKHPFDGPAGGADFATVSAHKVYGPKGVGALVMRARASDHAIEPLVLGGGQELGVRGGTPNVPGIVGLGEAARLVRTGLDDDLRRMRTLRDRFEDAVLGCLPGVWVNGDRARRLGNTSNLGFAGVDGRALTRDLHAVAASTRSACTSGSARPSHVLTAMGLADEDAYSCVRFSLGRSTTPEEVDFAAGEVVASVRKLRRLAGGRA